MDQRIKSTHDLERWAARGMWLIDKLRERSTHDNRTVLELVDEPIYVRQDGSTADWIAAVDAAMIKEANEYV
jgi:hypothetical protein